MPDLAQAAGPRSAVAWKGWEGSSVFLVDNPRHPPSPQRAGSPLKGLVSGEALSFCFSPETWLVQARAGRAGQSEIRRFPPALRFAGSASAAFSGGHAACSVD